MDNIIKKKIVVKEYKKGLVLVGFSLICFTLLFWERIKLPNYFFLLSSFIFCIGIVEYMITLNLRYLETKENYIYIYPTGKYSRRYEIPIERIASISIINSHLGLRRQNIKISLNQEYPPVWNIYNTHKTIYNESEIKLYSFPIAKNKTKNFINSFNSFCDIEIT